jgi:hypothetical protein
MHDEGFLPHPATVGRVCGCENKFVVVGTTKAPVRFLWKSGR